MIKIYKDKDSKDTSNDLETFNLGDVPILYRYRGRIPIFYKYNGIGKKVNYYFETMAFEETTIYSLQSCALCDHQRAQNCCCNKF